MIIGLIGKARSGKDTVAGMMLERIVNSSKYNLADPLKLCINSWLGWGYAHGYGDQKETPQAVKPDFKALVGYIIKYLPNITPEQASEVSVRLISSMCGHKYVGEMLDESGGRYASVYHIVSPRQVYQWFGTEGIRQGVSDDYWLTLIPKSNTTILADVRFENEADYVRDNGGVLIHIERPDCEVVAAHSSESNLSFVEGDILIDNNGSLSDLEAKVSQVLLDIEGLDEEA